MNHPGRGITLDYETSDRICLLTLIDVKKQLLDQLTSYGKGKFMHENDVAETVMYVDAVAKVIHYFGGEDKL